MTKPTYITPTFAVSAALDIADVSTAKGAGFSAIINNRPDGEQAGQHDAATMRAASEAAGLAYTHIPASKLDLFCDDVVEAMAEALATSTGPVLAHCQSGMRSAIVWAAAEARRRPVDGILADLNAAGFELDFLRDELDSQAARHLSRSSVDASPAPRKSPARAGAQRAA